MASSVGGGGPPDKIPQDVKEASGKEAPPKSKPAAAPHRLALGTKVGKSGAKADLSAPEPGGDPASAYKNAVQQLKDAAIRVVSKAESGKEKAAIGSDPILLGLMEKYDKSLKEFQQFDRNAKPGMVHVTEVVNAVIKCRHEVGADPQLSRKSEDVQDMWALHRAKRQLCTNLRELASLAKEEADQLEEQIKQARTAGKDDKEIQEDPQIQELLNMTRETREIFNQTHDSSGQVDQISCRAICFQLLDQDKVFDKVFGKQQ